MREGSFCAKSSPLALSPKTNKGRDTFSGGAAFMLKAPLPDPPPKTSWIHIVDRSASEGVKGAIGKPPGINIIENKDVPQKMDVRRGQGGDGQAPLE